MTATIYQTEIRYVDRVTKARYVWEKYRPILQHSTILDVGADECHLRRYLPDPTQYEGIGWGGAVDREVDLEVGQLAYDDRHFDCVMCCDVLEHLESAHRIFDELCRVARRHVIIALPNPWATFWLVLRGRGTSHDMKFYGMPSDRPADRHRWFFSATDAEHFIRSRAAKNGFAVAQLDFGWPDDRGWHRRMVWRRWLQRLRLLPNVPLQDLYAGQVWALLSRPAERVEAA